ncbi:MAG: polyphosphate kinase 1 [Leptolyngbya sp. SIO1D8]|nr:polyphosphate kinase 1 [Leptolyngbya sp. SIO1D8]
MRSSSGSLTARQSTALFDRELSWLAFNRRSLYEVADSKQPALQRLLKFAQVGAALDEYFMVRVPRLKRVGSGDGFSLGQQSLRSLIARQQAHFASNLRPRLAQHGIQLLDYEQLTDSRRDRFHRRFEDEIASVLAPFITPPMVSIPDFSNLSLNLAVCLLVEGQPALAWIKVPRSLPRFMVLPELNQDSAWLVVPLEQVIAAHLPTLLLGFQVQGAFSFRVTRSADLGSLTTDTSEAVNLLEMVEESLQQRQQQGQVVRLEVVQAMPQWVRSQLIDHLQLTEDDIYDLQDWLGFNDLEELTRLPRPDLVTTPWQPVLPAALVPSSKPSILSFLTAVPKENPALFEVLKKQDLLVHFPYHSFAATVEQFVAQAAADPAVLTIKMTLYRTSGDAPIVRSLMAAAKAGKQIVVLVELTAPLDEAINIHWAKSLEKAGAHVVYGVLGFKTHTNLALVIRHEANQISQYAYIGTGDYLPNRPQPYEDLGLLTKQPEIGRDLSYLFNFLTGCSHQVDYRILMVAPGGLRPRLKRLIEREIQQAQMGNSAYLIVKLNLLADPEIIALLYEASQAGVEINLIVRGICRLRPGIPGLSDRIRVMSILGRYVEHSRILYCYNGGQPEAWIGTADWTLRGLDERIEVMVPIQDVTLVAEIKQWLDSWLADNQDAWLLQPDGRYVRRYPLAGETALSAQSHFMQNATRRGQAVAS